jgi:hypothetical protein
MNSAAAAAAVVMNLIFSFHNTCMVYAFIFCFQFKPVIHYFHIAVMCNCQVGLLSEVVQELSGLIQELLSRRDSHPSSSSSSGIEIEMELEAELHRAHEDLEKMQRHLDSREEELKRRTEQVMELTSKV